MARRSVLGTLVTLVTANTEPFSKSMKGAEKSAVSFATRSRDVLNRSLARIGTSLTRTTKRLAKFGAASVAAGVAYSIHLAGQFEKTRMSFKTLLGSLEEANRLMSELREFAKSTPFQFDELADATRQLISYGFSAEESMKLLQQLGDAAAATTEPVGELATIFGRVRASGRMQLEELNQLMDRSFTNLEDFATLVGKTPQEFRKMVSAGQITFVHLQQLLDHLTSTGQQFSGGMENLAQTLPGKLSTLRDEVSFLLIDIGTALIEGFDLKGMVTQLTRFVTLYKNEIVATFVETSVTLAQTLIGLGRLVMTIQDALDSANIRFNAAVGAIAQTNQQMRFTPGGILGEQIMRRTLGFGNQAAAEGAQERVEQLVARQAQRRADRDRTDKILVAMLARLDKINVNTQLTAEQIQQAVATASVAPAYILP